MQHPHFALGAVQSELRLGPEWEAKSRRVQTQYVRTLGALGAEQGDLFAVDWDAVKALGQQPYNAALLSIAQGAQLTMPQATIDTAIITLLLRSIGGVQQTPYLNMFRVLFGLYPFDLTRFMEEREEAFRLHKELFAWWQATKDKYTLQRELQQANRPAREVTAAELKEIARIAGWTKKQIADATAGTNVYKLKPTPVAYYIAGAAAAGLLLYWAFKR